MTSRKWDILLSEEKMNNVSVGQTRYFVETGDSPSNFHILREMLTTWVRIFCQNLANIFIFFIDWVKGEIGRGLIYGKFSISFIFQGIIHEYFSHKKSNVCKVSNTIIWFRILLQRSQTSDQSLIEFFCGQNEKY